MTAWHGYENLLVFLGRAAGLLHTKCGRGIMAQEKLPDRRTCQGGAGVCRNSKARFPAENRCKKMDPHYTVSLLPIESRSSPTSSLRAGDEIVAQWDRGRGDYERVNLMGSRNSVNRSREYLQGTRGHRSRCKRLPLLRQPLFFLLSSNNS